MPSKKNTKKGPRNAAKADNEVEATMVAVDSQMQRLKIDTIDKDAQDQDEKHFWRRPSNLPRLKKKALKCNHGYSPRSSKENDRCVKFAAAFMEVAFPSNCTLTVGAIRNLFSEESEEATEKIFPGAWKNAEKLELIKSHFLSHGVEVVLGGDIEMAGRLAFVASHLEQWIDVMLQRAKAVPEVLKAIELLVHSDEHTIVSFFRKRIPCSCLDAKYEEVKSIKKMGICRGLHCSLPHGGVERSTMFTCTR